ncbi:hypothetical protein [Pontixanthobacter aquaemixtae]|uniref:Uncharacterized protein n=1 Tax=Pontixanthobacter aquaemixtae TaxID=1958940 RepID=A0A844ZUQ2_9SPHN|nr:hypothetical protein [Pontixanthobacter aquaemixtae]MXO90706.1 hypothetical protein [Pontixanthobacter aquaemixtae]
MAAHEASMNFDMEHVRPFLEQLNAKLSLGLAIDHLVSRIEATEHDSAYGCDLTVRFQGQDENLKFSAYIDDIDAPDLYFIVYNPDLATAIDAEMEAFCEANGS